MQSIWGRSKSKARKPVGNLKDRIGNPTPIDPIKINGSFIDLKASPQDGRDPGQEIAVPPIPQMPVVHAPAPESAKGLETRDDNSIEQVSAYQTNRPPHPSRSQSETGRYDLGLDNYFRGESRGNDSDAGWEQEYDHSFPQIHGLAAFDDTRAHQPQVRPYSPYTTRLNFSRPNISPVPDDAHSIAASISSVSSVSPSLTVTGQESTNPKSPIYSPARYIPYSPAAASQARGRPGDNRGQRSPTKAVTPGPDREQEEPLERGRSIRRSRRGRKRRSDSGARSESISLAAPSSGPPTGPLPNPRDPSRRRPANIDIQPAKTLQQSETAKFFESDTISIASTQISPLSSPYKVAHSPAVGSPAISPVLEPTTQHSSSRVTNLDLNKEEVSETLEISFSDFSMPSPGMGTHDLLKRPTASAPQSPEAHRLPKHLGPLIDVQREPGYSSNPSSPPSNQNSPKRSLSRKVSTRIKTLAHMDQHPPAGKGRVSKYNISNPIPIMEERQAMNMEIEEMMAQLEKERPRGLPRGDASDKVEEWNYNPSAASSASNISLHPTEVGSELSGGNPGLMSHRSSTRSSNRNGTPESPVTPADDAYAYPFANIRGHTSDLTIRPREYHGTSIGTKSSVEVPMFLDTTGEINGNVPSFTHEPPTPEPHKTTFPRLGVLPDLPSPRKYRNDPDENLHAGNRQHSRESNASSDSFNSDITMKSPQTISTAPTSVASSPMHPPTIYKRSPTARNPPFGNNTKMLLRAATMSSRQGAAAKTGPPLKPLKPALSIKSDPGLSVNHMRFGITPVNHNSKPPSLQDSRPSSAFSFVPEDAFASTANLDLQLGQNIPSLPSSRSNSPTPFDVDRSLPRQDSGSKPSSNLRPSPSRSQTGESIVPTLSTLPPRPSTADKDKAPMILRVDTSNLPPPTVSMATHSAVDAPKPSSSTLAPPSAPVKRSKSVGEGLRRAFSRRAPNAPPPMPTEPMPPLPGSETSSPVDVSGPLGYGQSSETSMARWGAAMRAAQVASALGANGSPTASTNSGHSLNSPVQMGGGGRRQSVFMKAQPLTAEDRRGMQHAPGTLFMRTCEEMDDGEIINREHRMKPRKGGVAQKCAFCEKGPFANMWVCLDENKDPAPAQQNDGPSSPAPAQTRGKRCEFVVCRMCCNEKVQEGSAEIF
ncbi:hypothetical protein FPQ18DRAFT_383376 [Pyronema domesticum]|nr:hypothetical protein FPQ18DRAFT_383376 [Pyronema domesticum]